MDFCSSLDDWINTKPEERRSKDRGTTVLVAASRFEMPGSEDLKSADSKENRTQRS